MEQLQVRYAGYFEHSVFHVLGNPADLYRNLLRRFHTYGADLQSLSVNLAELAHPRQVLLSSRRCSAWQTRHRRLG